MGECELIGGCAFFGKEDRAHKVTELLRSQYCQGDPSACARHMIAMAVGQEHVPTDLYPNEIHSAHQIIDEA